MITDIRKTLKTTQVKVLIWVSLASLVGGSAIALLVSRLISGRTDVVATVNGHDVTVVEFARRLTEIQNFISQIKQTQGVNADEVLKMWGLDKRPHEFALEGLIGEKVMKSAGRSLGAQIHPEYVQSKIKDPYFVYQHLRGIIPPEAMSGGTINPRALQANLDRLGISEADFDDLLHDALLRAFLFNLVEAGLYIPDDALKNGYISQEVKKKYAVLPLARSRYVQKAKETPLSDQDIENYYSIKAHQETYRIPEKRSAKVWSFSPETFGLAISDSDLTMAYNRNKRSYVKKPEQVKVQHILFTFTEDTKTDVRGKAQEVYNKVKEAPEKFAELAAQHSASSDKGSTITVKRTDKNRTFATIAFGLKKDGISPVQETSEGFEIIKLIEKVPAEYKALDEVKGELTSKLQKEKFDRLFASNAQRVVSQAKDAPALLTKFIEQHNGQLSTIKDVTPGDTNQLNRLFKLRKIGDIGFYQEGDKGYLIELTALEPSKVPPLSAIKAKVTEDIYASKAEEMISADLKQGLADIRAGKKTLAQVAQSLNGTVDITDWIVFNDRETLKKFQDMKLNLPELAQLIKQGAATSDLTDTHGYLIQVKQIDKVDPENYEKEKARIRTRLSREESQGLSAAFIQSLRDQANVSLNEQLLRQV